ncbi:MAG: bifunctional 5,10-methylenetetrahydrofolate dehydrogenase/5,10-methenyltetrahydrofolate cyclohydrolase [Patescibacteria group bacterium]|nr:bifunctional 5,10-methylenetetrahydrofolate dehydrogenase/5,10-methenyltetrahydrofolate cyclohydrolase [Patescibacteria group bacterium]MDE2590083.1 bifunctional 5,10-methylenetetrahydrofolate dehydrogenase/5,10-methenyltetrahydrofolate cyclohydrolase [Patescibacteria group bacterium]
MLIDGKLLAAKILEDLKKKVEDFSYEKNKIPHLGVIVVGEDPATASYVRQKKKMGEQIGGTVSVYNYPSTVTERELEQNIDFLQQEGDLDGLIIQLPLPKHLHEEELTNRVEKDKDVDGFREDSEFDEPIAIAVIRILEEIYDLEQSKEPNKRIDGKIEPNFTDWLKTQKVVVMGKGKTGGKPIITIMKKYGIEPIIVDSKTHNPSEVTMTADILVCAVGGRGTIVNESMIKKDAILIAIGMSLGQDGKLHGDYEPEEIASKAAYYTPIPGGVGPVNAAMLLVNVVDAAKKNNLV